MYDIIYIYTHKLQISQFYTLDSRSSSNYTFTYS